MIDNSPCINCGEPDGPLDYHECTPTCDICDEPEDHEVGLIEYDWNGETGNHLSCEDRQNR
jgi:hypothetical protein